MNTWDYIVIIMISAPLVGALLSWSVDKLSKVASTFLGILTVGVSGILSLVLFITAATSDLSFEGIEMTLLDGTTSYAPLHLAIIPDQLSIFMGLVAAFLGMLIAIFSYEYMKGDENLSRYWFYLQLFVVGMLLLVFASDFVLLYTGWEIVGLCSYGLISHWHTKPDEEGEKCGRAGIKAFIFTRIGDIGLLTAIVVIYHQYQAIDFASITAQNLALSDNTLNLITCLLLAAAFGKSAQIPFIPWLSSPESVDVDAMQGPTTVSALIHAATMVKAGVYLISRTSLVFDVHAAEIFQWILILGAGITALIAALSALTSFDIKRIFAYSTVSQLAYMFLGLGMASLVTGEESETAFLTSQFHLISHALFKSLLFLTAGYLIHIAHSRNIKDMIGLGSWNHDKVAFLGLLTGGLALAGVPPLNGFFSKESLLGISYEIMIHEETALAISGYVLAVTTAGITALYVGRLFGYLLVGEPKHESKGYPVMKLVVLTLSVLTVLGGIFMMVLPDFFVDLLPDGHLGFGEGTELLISIAISLGVIVLVVLSFLFIKDRKESVASITGFPVVREILILGEQGFFLEHLWQGGFELLKAFAYRFRKVHTGDLNWMTALAAGTSFIVIFTLVGGGLS